ncbi:hypothetical protein NN561_006434 [Cricetulus griseus]
MIPPRRRDPGRSGVIVEGTVGEVALPDSSRPRPCQKFKKMSSSRRASPNKILGRAIKSDGPERKGVPPALTALGCADEGALESGWGSVVAAGGSWLRHSGQTAGSRVPSSPTSVRAPRAKQTAVTRAHAAAAAATSAAKAAGLLTWRTMKRELEGSEPEAKSALCTNSGGARVRV